MKVFFASSYNEIKEFADQCSLHAANAIFYYGTSNFLDPSILEKCSYKTYAHSKQLHKLLMTQDKYYHMKSVLEFIIAYLWSLVLVGLPLGIIWLIFNLDWLTFFVIIFVVAIIIKAKKNL